MYALTGYACTHARTGPMHARTHWARAHLLTLGPHARSLVGPMHACSHRVPMPACTGSPHPFHLHAHMHWVQVPMPTHSRGPCMHACTHRVFMPVRSQGPHACMHWAMCACSLQVPMPACMRGPHACMHWAYTRTLTLGPHARSHRAPTPAHTEPPPAYTEPPPAHTEPPSTHTGPPCPLDCGVPMHVCRIPALMHAASHVVCSSSYVTYGRYILAFRDDPKRRLTGFLYLER